MIIFKQSVTADAKYTQANQPNCVLFDVHNDSPYNMGISFGRDTGADNADYFTSPHSVLTGIGPKGNAPSINNVKWTGTIFIYTQTPLGTGATDLASAPAFQITVIGYPVGYQPTGTTSLSRMTATPNTVSTTVSNATSVTNTGFGAGTQFIFAMVAGDIVGSFTATNDGTLLLGSTSENGQLTIKGRDSQQVIVSNDSVSALDNLGHFLTVLSTLGFQIQDTGGHIRASLGPGGKLQLNDATGNLLATLDGLNGWLGNGKGTIHAGQVVSGDTWDTDANGNLYFKSASLSNPSVNFQPVNGTNAFTINSDKFVSQNGARWDHETAGVVVNGNTSGTATVIQDCIGLVKRVLIVFNNFRNGGAAQTVGLPVAFSFGMRVKSGGIGTSATNGGLGFVSGGINQNIGIITTLAAAGGSVAAGQNFIFSFSEGEIVHAIDSLQFQAAGTAAHSGFVEIIGQ